MFAVYYDAMDEDKTLFVKSDDRLHKCDVVVHRGTEKACRLYVHENQHKASTPSLKRMPRTD